MFCSVAVMCSWVRMSGLTLREDKREMIVIRNNVVVTFEASFHIQPPFPLFLASLPFLSPAHCPPLYLSLILLVCLSI